MAWIKTQPTTGTLVVDLPKVFIDNWTYIETTLGAEHYTFTAGTTAGRHPVGKIPAVFTGPTSAINALPSSAPSGALAFDTTVGSLRVKTATPEWRLASLWPTSRVLVYRNGDQILSPGIESPVAFNTENLDMLSEYDTTSYVFSPNASGWCYLYGQVSFVGIGGTYGSITLYQRDSTGAVKNRIMHSNFVMDTNPVTLTVFGMLECLRTDRLSFHMEHDRAAACLIEGGATKSYMFVQRLS